MAPPPPRSPSSADRAARGGSSAPWPCRPAPTWSGRRPAASGASAPPTRSSRRTWHRRRTSAPTTSPPRGAQPAAPPPGRGRGLGADARRPRRDGRPERLADERRPASRRPIRWPCPRLLLDPAIDAILAGAGDPPRPEERSADRRAGGPRRRGRAAAGRSCPIDPGRRDVRGPWPRSGRRARARGDRSSRRPAAAPAEATGPLGDLLLELALPADDPRRAIGPATQALADVLDRRIETIVLGHDAAVRALADAVGRRRRGRSPASPSCRPRPSRPTTRTTPWSMACSSGRRSCPTAIACATGCASCASPRGPTRRARGPRCAWPPPGPPWSASSRATPDSAGDRARSRRHRGRRVVLGPRPRPWRWPSSTSSAGRAPASTPSTMPACSAPLGAIPDAGERLAVMADLADDLLAPLGSVVTPAGLRAGRSAGSLIVHAEAGRPNSTSSRAASSSSTCRRARPPWPSSSSATRSGSATAAGTSRSTWPAAWRPARRPARRPAAAARAGRSPARPPGGLAGRRCGPEPTDDRARRRPRRPRARRRRGRWSRPGRRHVRARARRPATGRGRRIGRGRGADRRTVARPTASSTSPDHGRRRRTRRRVRASRRASCCSTGGAAGAWPAAR